MTVSLPAMQRKTRLPNPATLPLRRLSLQRRPPFRILLATSAFLALLLLYLPPHYIPRPPPFSHGRRFLRRALRSYQRLLHLHPLESRALTAGVIFFIADFSAQVLQTPAGKSAFVVFSVPRLMRYSLYGLLIMGPFLYVWYAAMNEYGAADDLRGSLIKCLFEQLTLEPICISMYMVYDALVCRRGLRAIRTALRTNFFPLWFKNAVFWLPANFANYYIGTPDLRVVFANLCSLFWNIYFSGKVNRIARPAFVDKRFLNHDRDPAAPKSLSISRRPAASSESAILIV